MYETVGRGDKSSVWVGGEGRIDATTRFRFGLLWWMPVDIEEWIRRGRLILLTCTLPYSVPETFVRYHDAGGFSDLIALA